MSSLPQLGVIFDSFDELVESIGPDLSRTHLFARTHEVIDEGTRVRLEIGTVGKGALIRGVAKIAGPGHGRESPEPGLHLHIIHLDPSSTRLVDSIVRGEISAASAEETSGPSPFDIPQSESVHEVEEPQPEAIEPPVSVTPDRLRRVAWPLVLAVLAGILVLIFELATRDSENSPLTGSDRKTEVHDLETTAEAPQATTATADDLGPEEPGTNPPETDTSEADTPETDTPKTGAPTPDGLESERIAREVEHTLSSWAAAWSRQDPAAYLELYAADYSPPGIDRETWERQRRARITAPERVDVSVSEVEVEIVGPSRATVRFHQLYTTDEKALAARKALELERLAASWKIVAERVEP